MAMASRTAVEYFTIRLPSFNVTSVFRRTMNSPSSSSSNLSPTATVPLPLLITGTAGVAGFNALQHFRKVLGPELGQQVIGQRPINNWRLSGPGIEACDLEDAVGVCKLVEKYRFKSVLSCGGSCALKSCELDPAMANRVNVIGPTVLLDSIDAMNQTAGHTTRIVHLSIDLVFSGTANGDHVETDPVDPVTVYGKTMVEAENLLAARRPDACILRISLPMGVSFNGHAGAVDWIQSRFKANKPATLYFDEVRTPTYVECLNEVVGTMLASDHSGIFHCGAPRKLSLYQIAQVVNRVGGYPPELLFGCPRAEAGPMPPRAGDVTMDSSKLLAALPEIQLAPWPLDPSLAPTDRCWHFERPDGEIRGVQQIPKVLYQKPQLPSAS